MGGYAWVTLVTNDTYGLGAMILGHTLRHVGTAHELVVLVTAGVSVVMRQRLSCIFNLVEEVDVMDSKDELNLGLLKRPELGITFTKLHCWRLTQFEKCVFLDADIMILDNVDELFEREEFSAAPDVGWPDCFNSGVFVYRPSIDTYRKLVQFALETGSFDGGDQGLLNLYFSNWAHEDIGKHLPFIYNMCSSASYSYLPAFKQFSGQAKIIHFIGNTKPWLFYFDTESQKVVVPFEMMHLEPFIRKWWNTFCFLVHPALTSDMTGLAGTFAQLVFGLPRTLEQMKLDSYYRRQGWEAGSIDYMGVDSFDRVWGRILNTVDTPPEVSPSGSDTGLQPSPSTSDAVIPSAEGRPDVPDDQKEPETSESQQKERKLEKHEEKLEISELAHVEEPIGTSGTISLENSDPIKSMFDSDFKAVSITKEEIARSIETTITAGIVAQESTSIKDSGPVLEKVTEKNVVIEPKSDCPKVTQATPHIEVKETTTPLPEETASMPSKKSLQLLSTQSVSSSTTAKEVPVKEAVTKDTTKPLGKTDPKSSSETPTTKSPKSVPTKAATAPVAPPRKGGSSGGDKKKGGKGKK